MNPDNYGSLPACKKLAEILAKKGIGVVTEAAWCEYGPDDWRIGYRGLIEDDPRHRKFIPAYSMPEVWRELPEHFNNKVLIVSKSTWNTGRTIAGYGSAGDEHSTNPNPADALIYLKIWVLEQED